MASVSVFNICVFSIEPSSLCYSIYSFVVNRLPGETVNSLSTLNTRKHYGLRWYETKPALQGNTGKKKSECNKEMSLLQVTTSCCLDPCLLIGYRSYSCILSWSGSMMPTPSRTEVLKGKLFLNGIVIW